MAYRAEIVHFETGRSRWVRVDGDSPTTARASATHELRPLESVGRIEEVKTPGSSKPLSQEDQTEFCLNLSDLMAASQHFDEALRKMRAMVPNKRIQQMLDRMIVRYEKGGSIAPIFEAEESVLGRLVVAMAAQGEAIGDVPGAMQQTVKMLDRQTKRMMMLLSNLAMPVAGLGMMVVSFIGFALIVIPMMEEQIEPGTKLNFLSQMVFGYSHVIRDTVWLWVPLLALYVYLVVSRPAFRTRQFQFILNWFPRARLATRSLQHGDFCAILGALLKGGMKHPDALALCSRRFKSTALGDQLKPVHEAVVAGGDMAEALKLHTNLPESAISAVRVAIAGDRAGDYLLDNSERAYWKADRHFSAFGIQATVVALVLGGFGAVLLFLGSYAPNMQNIQSVAS